MVEQSVKTDSLANPAPMALLSQSQTEIAVLTVNVVLEEAIRFSHPLAGVALGCFEYGLRIYQHGIFRGDVPPFIGHLALSYLAHKRGWSFKTCTAIHWFWNMYCVLGKGILKAMLYNSFKTAHAEGRFVEAQESYSVPIPAGDELPPLQSAVSQWTAPIRGSIDIRVNGEAMTPTDALQALDGEVYEKNTMFPILITQRLLWEPARTQKNLLVALLSRVHKIPKCHASTPESREKAWRQAFGVLQRSGALNYHVIQNTSFEEAMKAMGKKGDRLIRAHDREIEEGSDGYSKTMSLKWNETITAGKEVEGVLTIKPRAITNLDATGLAHTAPWSRDLAEAEKKHMFHRNIVILDNGLEACFIYASGLDQEGLDELGNFARTAGCVVVAASGDDTFFVFGKYSDYFGMKYGEGDLSMADQSQDKSCFHGYQFPVMRVLGTPKKIIEILEDQCKNKYAVTKENMSVKGDGGFQLPTGTTFTSFCNTNTSLGGSAYALNKCDLKGKCPDLQELFAECGLDLKFIKRETFSEVTFLKGWWIPDIHGRYHWLPSPGQAIKIGKVLSNPVTTTTVTRRGKTVRLAAEEAVKVVAWAIYKGYANLEPTYPILGPFVQVLKRLGKPSTGANEVEGISEKYNRVELKEIPKLDDTVLNYVMEARYGITAVDQIKLQQTLDSVLSLPALVVDPTFDRLCDVDYPSDVSADIQPMSLFNTVMGGWPIKPTTFQPVMFNVAVKTKRSKRVRKGKKTAVVVQVKGPGKTKKSRRRGRKGKGGAGRGANPLSADGNAFLKCVTSPCDFVAGSTGFMGIPDAYDDRVIVDEARSVTGLPSYTAGQDIYIIQPPIPGVAYMWGVVAGGTRTNAAIAFTPVYYPNVTTMFPTSGTRDTVVDKFRVASNAIELVNTTNDMTWAGSIEGFKLDLSQGTFNDSFADLAANQVNIALPIILGFDGLYTSEPGYVAAIKDGIYMTAFNQQSAYPFLPIASSTAISNMSNNQTKSPAGNQNQLTTFATVAPDVYVGFGSLETNVIRIPAAVAGQSMRIRTWSCVEYTVPSTSILWHFSHLSPPEDQLAMALLKQFHHQFPIAVTAAQNATFWENVRKWMGRITKLGGYLPGPVGAISTLVNNMVKTGDVGFSLDS
jgi:hypothetical protein